VKKNLKKRYKLHSDYDKSLVVLMLVHIMIPL